MNLFIDFLEAEPGCVLLIVWFFADAESLAFDELFPPTPPPRLLKTRLVLVGVKKKLKKKNYISRLFLAMLYFPFPFIPF